MKKAVIVSLAVLLIGAAVAAGCGGKSTKTASSPAQKVLADSQAKMQEIQTVKLAGKAVVLTPQSEVKEESFDFTADMKLVSKDDVEMHMVAKDSTGKPTDVYMVGGYIYTNDPTTGWTKQKAESSTSGSVSGSLMSPTGLTELSKYATNMKMVTDPSGKYVVSFDVGPKFFEQVINQAAQAGNTQTSTPSTEDQKAAEQLAQTMKDMMAGIQMGVVYKIDKSTLLADSSTIKMSLKGAPIVGDMSADMNVNFSDYNAPVTITLPPEAQNAREVQPGPSGIPSIPGLPL
jgi:uncharacterized protein YdeI (BOF family)